MVGKKFDFRLSRLLGSSYSHGLGLALPAVAFRVEFLPVLDSRGRPLSMEMLERQL